MINKSFVVKYKIVEITLNEKQILSVCDFTFVLGYVNSFQTNSYLCLVIELAPGGDLYAIIENSHPLPIKIIKFYVAQMLLALHYLYTISIIHRDIKPQNVLVSKNGYLRLADFGVSKILKNSVTYTFTGTREYIAPEMLCGKGYNVSVDWWAFGCVVYEMFETITLFFNEDENTLMNNIKKRKLTFSPNFTDGAKDFISKLLCPEPSRRLGCSAYGPIEARNHQFLENIHWLDLYKQNIPTPFKPSLSNYKEIEPDTKLQNIPEEEKQMKYEDLFKRF